jgi:hypothetical protein
MSQPGVVDDQAGNRFVVEQDGSTAHLAYLVGDGILVLVHTEVPDELEGRGIGGSLVRAAAVRASSEGLTIHPWCPFARKWLEDHPDVAATLTIDWTNVGPPK